MEDEATSLEKKAVKGIWDEKEDTLLISAWLNTSKDPILGNQQKSDGFWKKIGAYYNEHRTPDMPVRGHHGVMKNRWYRISASVNKFEGCYACVIQRGQSGLTESDMICQAEKIYKEETGKRFNCMHAWRMLREQAKWLNEYSESSSTKRTKISAAGAYTSSSNVESIEPRLSPPNIAECNPSSAVGHPISQNATKRKEKASVVEPTTSIDVFIDHFSSIQDTSDRKLAVISELAKAKAENARVKQRQVDMEVIRMDTSGMDAECLEVHKMMVAEIKERLGKL